MPRGIMYVETMPVSGDEEADYHEWYNDTHLAEIVSVEGIVSARRFAPIDGNGPFIAIYELDSDDLAGAVARLAALGRSGQMSSLEHLQLDPPPVTRVYREIASYPPESAQ
ncbi:hypothetical protein [Mycobacterium sp.]|uniref:hypothetical protein n=1 Tax=Mycobacterium sp. TaxID=1785 RepID=UPI002C3C18AA|nr:hypothetical protein [Mycobacterium sp.]HME49422.1 hypothetical protein [Mycobacterium sp.]